MIFDHVMFSPNPYVLYFIGLQLPQGISIETNLSWFLLWIDFFTLEDKTMISLVTLLYKKISHLKNCQSWLH